MIRSPLPGASIRTTTEGRPFPVSFYF